MPSQAGLPSTIEWTCEVANFMAQPGTSVPRLRGAGLVEELAADGGPLDAGDAHGQHLELPAVGGDRETHMIAGLQTHDLVPQDDVVDAFAFAGLVDVLDQNRHGKAFRTAIMEADQAATRAGVLATILPAPSTMRK